MSNAWFVLFCNAQAMTWRGGCFALEEGVREQGYQTYTPVERRYIRHQRRRREIVRSVLGPYVFVRFDRESDDWPQLLNVDGVHEILQNQDVPVRVKDDDIDKLKRAESAGVFDYVAVKSPFKINDKVQICEGAWSGLMAKVLSASPRKRVRILLCALGVMEVDPCILRKV